MSPNPATPLLDTVATPADLRKLPPGDLRQKINFLFGKINRGLDI